MASFPKQSVLVMDAQPVARCGLVQLINSHARFRVCAEAETAPIARDLCRRYRPALAVLDIALADGFSLVKELSTTAPRIRVVAFTGLEDALSVQRALQAGARAYVTRHDPAAELLTALVCAVEGQRHLSPRVSHLLLERLACGAVEMVGSEESALSDRELQIFHAIGRGLGTRTIAEELHVSVKTVETHRQRIKEKLHLRDGCDLQRRAVLFHHAACA
jgi:DNA-binding NarL/FixJ family response regulator